MPLGVESGEFRALGFPRIKSVLQAVLLKCSLKGFFMAKKGLQRQGIPGKTKARLPSLLEMKLCLQRQL